MAAADQSSRPIADGEWYQNWPMVLAAMIGVSFVSVAPATLGLFMAPLQAEFGWSRTEISAGMTIFALVSLPLMPVAGALVDRFGSRHVALTGLVLSSFAFAAFGLLGGSLFQWFAMWVALTLASLLIGLLVWTSAVSGVFKSNRGLALALVLCGAALAQTLAPIIARWLIDDLGWRVAYFGIAAGWGGLAFLMVFCMFRDRRPIVVAHAHKDAAPPAQTAGGLSVKEALRRPVMCRLAFATFLQTFLSAAALVHLVPLLTSSGLSRSEAASLAALLGIASVAGKLLTGYLLDRIRGSWLPVVCYSGPGLAYLMLLEGAGSLPLLSLAIFVLGYTGGASLQLTTYLTTRYVGLRNFGKIFGIISMLLALGGGLGPLVAGAVFDAFASYEPLLIGGIFGGVIAGLCTLRLGPYPDFSAITYAEPPSASAT